MRQLGWAAFDTPAARHAAAGKARVAVVILSLHLVFFQFILSAVYLDEVGSSSGILGVPGILFLGLALLYLILAVLVGLDTAMVAIFGYAVCAVSLFLWMLVLAAGPPFSTFLPQSAWLVFASVIDALGVVLGLLLVRDRSLEPRAATTA